MPLSVRAAFSTWDSKAARKALSGRSARLTPDDALKATVSGSRSSLLSTAYPAGENVTTYTL
jgi:hypothetical protein